MSTLRRIAASITTSFDWMVNQIENHEALVETALREMQQAAGKARVQLKRVKLDGKKMRESLDELSNRAETWAQRAVRIRDEDEKKALDCIRRRNAAKKERAQVEKRLEAHSKLEVQLESDLKQIYSRLEELKQKKNMYLAREYRAKAQQVGKLPDIDLITEVDDIFVRWDSKIDLTEIYAAPADELEEEFSSQEEEEELLAELDELTKQ